MPPLVGRDPELRALDDLIEQARGARSASLVIRGEPGIGKSALLDAAEERAGDGMRVLRCVGIEAEHELAFAGAHQLVRPCLDLIDQLPPPQATALKSAFGLSEGSVGERFLVSLGLLSLLAEYSEGGPVLCLIDDAQWLDRPSAEALVFAARRVEAEPIAFLIAAREGDVRRFEGADLSELELAGISDADAEELLRSTLEREPPPEVRSTLLATAAGNPLALLELPAGLTPGQLDGTEPLVGPPRARGAVEERYRAQLEALPDPARLALLIAAADEVGDVGVVRKAVEGLGGSFADIDPAVDARLVELGDTVRFRHPLMRSAAYRSASPEDRARAHKALAGAIEDPSRSIWHRAAAAEGSDDTLAAELEVSGDQASLRGAQATAATAFERAAELSQDDDRRAHRLRRAAETSMDAGRTDIALALAERARRLSNDPAHLAALDMIRGLEAGRRGSPLDCHLLTRAAAGQFAEAEPDQARTLYLWSFFISFQGGFADRIIDDTQEALRSIEGGTPELRSYGLAIVDGVAAVVAGDIQLARDRLDEAERIAEALGNAPLATMPAFSLLVRAEFGAMCEILERGIAEQRARGVVIGLSGSIGVLAGSQVFDRRLRPAISSIDEGLQLARQLGYDNDETGLLALRARLAGLQGRQESCREDAEAAMRRSLANGVGWATLNARLALVELELGLGNAQESLQHLDQLEQSLVPPIAMASTPDLVDAALRVGERDRAVEAVEAFRAWAPVSRSPLIKATLARSRAQVEDDDEEAERLFGEALAHHEESATAFERARTLLALGEWLRRKRRRSDARAHLRTALDTFEGVGAASWAERARGELQATGEAARRRDVSTLDDLTPQELRIARLVASGATNRDVGAQLFVSPKTVEYHLRKVFMKLGVSSRVELAGADFGDAEAAA